MKHILCIETATKVCSVCIANENGLLAIRESEDGYSHTEFTSIYIQEVLAEAKLPFSAVDAVAVSAGPGSYTGLRVGVSIAKGLCTGNSKPLIAINTLESLAKMSISEENSPRVLHVSMIDARRMEVYLAAYTPSDGEIQENIPYIIEDDSFEKWLESYDSIILSGNGAPKCMEKLQHLPLKDSKIRCSSKNLISPAFDRLSSGLFEDLAYFSPNYIKSPNITKSTKNLF